VRLPAPVLCCLCACNEYDLFGKKDPGITAPEDYPPGPEYGGSCFLDAAPPEVVGQDDTCDLGYEPGSGFEPVVDWEYTGGSSVYATVAVGDLDHDGFPEIVANVAGLLLGAGDLVVLDGRDGTVKAYIEASLGYGSSPAIGDLDGDGEAEIVVAMSYGSALPFGQDSYTIAAFSNTGALVWETPEFSGDDFDYATAVHLSDMDHDGFVEIVAGRVILNYDGSLRGVGEHGRGSWGILPIGGLSEGAVSAVADIDLDGIEEVIVGDAVYAPDGTTLWHDPSQWDGMIGLANLDDDPEGEFVAASFNTIRAVDTNGVVMWGPWELPDANITSPPAVGDIDNDGKAEVIVAGGDRIWALNHDGSVLWNAAAHDMSGASGASIFDFEGDGIKEVVYIDEREMQVFDGPTGAVKFYTNDHASPTMMDYAVIADVDADGHADIVFGHSGHRAAFSVYRDKFERWAPTRTVWNQHAFHNGNVNDDLSIPDDAVPSFVGSNTWHAAEAIGAMLPPTGQLTDLTAEIVNVCDDDCESGIVPIEVRVHNIGPWAEAGPVGVAVYAVEDTTQILVGFVNIPGPIDPGMTSVSAWVEAPAIYVDPADELWAVADDDGSGVGTIAECDEDNNLFIESDPFCL
jgi:hypothetical protein